jgi:hypothetical protein
MHTHRRLVCWYTQAYARMTVLTWRSVISSSFPPRSHRYLTKPKCPAPHTMCRHVEQSPCAACQNIQSTHPTSTVHSCFLPTPHTQTKAHPLHSSLLPCTYSSNFGHDGTQTLICINLSRAYTHKQAFKSYIIQSSASTDHTCKARDTHKLSTHARPSTMHHT